MTTKGEDLNIINSAFQDDRKAFMVPRASGKICPRIYSGHSFLGRLESDTFDTLVLRPSLVNEAGLHFDDRGELKFTTRYRLETERPTVIDTRAVQTVEPTTEERADYLVRVTNRRKSNSSKRSQNSKPL